MSAGMPLATRNWYGTRSVGVAAGPATTMKPSYEPAAGGGRASWTVTLFDTRGASVRDEEETVTLALAESRGLTLKLNVAEAPVTFVMLSARLMPTGLDETGPKAMRSEEHTSEL